MKRIPIILFVVLLIVGSQQQEQLSATQQSSNQTTIQSQSASQPASKTRTSTELWAPMPATLARALQLGSIPDKPKTVVIPAGSVITVRLVNPPDSSSKVGDAFNAIVTGLIAVGGEVVVPSGVAAGGKVIGVRAKGKATEKVRFKLALTSFTIDGTPYSIETKLVKTKAQGKSKSTTATTSDEFGASAESGLVFKLTAPVTVNRQRNGGTG